MPLGQRSGCPSAWCRSLVRTLMTSHHPATGQRPRREEGPEWAAVESQGKAVLGGSLPQGSSLTPKRFVPFPDLFPPRFAPGPEGPMKCHLEALTG